MGFHAYRRPQVYLAVLRRDRQEVQFGKMAGSRFRQVRTPFQSLVMLVAPLVWQNIICLKQALLVGVNPRSRAFGL